MDHPSAKNPSPHSPDSWLHESWERHRAWVPALLLAHKPRWADVDDLLQEVALQVLRKGHEVRDPQAFPGWLRTLAINVARVAARKGPQAGWRGIRAVLGLGTSLSAASGVGTADQRDTWQPQARETAHDHAAATCEHAQRILHLASELDDDYREPLLLKAVHGMSYREIGTVMGLPESTIETRVARGRKKLRELIERDEAAKKNASRATEARVARIPLGST